MMKLGGGLWGFGSLDRVTDRDIPTNRYLAVVIVP